MEIRPLHQKFVEEVWRDAQGRLARVTFFVYEHEGRMKARVIKVVYLEEERFEKKDIPALAGNVAGSKPEADISLGESDIVSPYFDTEFLYTIGSKPRAPASF
jgi:hypothetical protein